MTVKELRSYFENRLDDEEVKFIVVNPKGRILWRDDKIDVVPFTHGVIPVIDLVVQAAEESEVEKERLPEPWAAHYMDRFEKVK